MENENNVDYGKIIDEELSKDIPENKPSSEPQTETPPSPEQKLKPKKTLFVVIAAIACLILATIIIVFVATSNPFSKNTPETPTETNEDPSVYSFKMPELGVAVELPESFKNKVFYESDGETYYIWGYFDDEKPDYITVDKESPDFFPFFALNESKEAFSNEKFSFLSGDGAYGYEDGRVLYLHTINLESIDELKPLAQKNEEELNENEKTLLEKYTLTYEEINYFMLFFKDGFKYQEI